MKERALELRIDEKAKKVAKVLGDECCSHPFELLFDVARFLHIGVVSGERSFIVKNGDVKIRYSEKRAHDSYRLIISLRRGGFFPFYRYENVYHSTKEIDTTEGMKVQLFKEEGRLVNILDNLYQKDSVRRSSV